MFMHSDNVVVDSAGFYGLGRTDKRNAFDDPKLDELTGAFTPGYGTNPRGRYAVHFHRTGLSHVDQPAVIRGSAVVDSPGWGFVNHSSNVLMEDNVAYDVIGAAFTTEAGDEIGAFRRNIAIKSTGSGAGIEAREDVQDFGHQGDGFWFQGGGVEVVGNIAVGQKHAGFVYFTQGLVEAGLGTREFLSANLPDPSIAGGAEHLAVADVPIRLFANNEAFANGGGFESWFHMLNAKHTAPSVVEGFRAWNNGSKAMFIPYTNRLVVRNSMLTGNVNRPSSTGIGRNDVTKNITYESNTIAGFRTGIDAPVNGQNFVTGGVFNNGTNILVSTANERGRMLDIGGGVLFLSPAAEALAAAGIDAHYDISLRANFDPKHQDITRVFNADVIKLGTVKYNGVQLYYNEQAADFVPFVKGEAQPYVPRCLLNKTNAQLWAKYGLAVGGTVAPKDAVRDPLINAMIGAPAVYLPKLSLSSAKYTNNVTGYKLSYRDEAGVRTTEATVSKLREGWNLLVRKIGGVNRTFFVFGDTITATFELAPDQSLVLNPADLKTGFTLRGSVVDNSFGRMNFKKRFKDLDQLPLQTDADGVTRFIALSFPIRDFAGNTVTVQLKVIVDPNAPLQKDIGRKVFGRKQISATLVALLGFRDRDAA